jgi:hypothetical protein
MQLALQDIGQLTDIGSSGDHHDAADQFGTP